MFSSLAILITLLVLRDHSFTVISTASIRTPAAPTAAQLQPPETPEEKTAAAIASLDAFFKITDPAGRLPLVFDPRSESAAIPDYYVQRGRADPDGIHEHKVTAILEKDREILIVTFKDEKDRIWAAPFEWKTNAYRLHWASMTGYGEVPWDRFLTERPAAPVSMRVNIYIPDSESPALLPPGHTFVLLTHPELENPLGALLAPSESLKPLLKLPRNTDIPTHVTMQWLAIDGSGDWPVITDLIHRNWIR